MKQYVAGAGQVEVGRVFSLTLSSSANADDAVPAFAPFFAYYMPVSLQPLE